MTITIDINILLLIIYVWYTIVAALLAIGLWQSAIFIYHPFEVPRWVLAVYGVIGGLWPVYFLVFHIILPLLEKGYDLYRRIRK